MIGANRGPSFKLGSEPSFVEPILPSDDLSTLPGYGEHWIAEQRTMPIAEAEKEFGLEPGTLRKLGASQQ
ncbi:MAG: hypothetical protein C0483_18615 [Pirellula sp.]|nr:hypothetical protein [Pirellula sp.]